MGNDFAVASHGVGGIFVRRWMDISILCEVTFVFVFDFDFVFGVLSIPRIGALLRYELYIVSFDLLQNIRHMTTDVNVHAKNR